MVTHTDLDYRDLGNVGGSGKFRRILGKRELNCNAEGKNWTNTELFGYSFFMSKESLLPSIFWAANLKPFN